MVRFFIILLLVLATFFVYLLRVNQIGDMPTQGLFGDQFGGLNALFSGLALAAVVTTLWYQREDLKTQQEMLSAQLQAMDDAKEEQEGIRKAQTELVRKHKVSTQILATSTMAQSYLSRAGNKSLTLEEQNGAKTKADFYENIMLQQLSEVGLSINHIEFKVDASTTVTKPKTP